MNLFLLRQKQENPIYESVDMMIVRASTEQGAREIAGRNSREHRAGAELWDEQHAEIKVIGIDGPPGIILASWQHGC